MFFEIVGRITEIEVVATGKGIREIRKLRRLYRRPSLEKVERHGHRETLRWTIGQAEVHWYEAHGVGAKEFKIKRIVQEETETKPVI